MREKQYICAILTKEIKRKVKKVSKANDLPKIKVSTKARNITMSTGKKKKKASKSFN